MPTDARVSCVYIREDRIKCVSLGTAMKVDLQEREANDPLPDDGMKKILYLAGVVLRHHHRQTPSNPLIHFCTLEVCHFIHFPGNMKTKTVGKEELNDKTHYSRKENESLIWCSIRLHF